MKMGLLSKFMQPTEDRKPSHITMDMCILRSRILLIVSLVFFFYIGRPPYIYWWFYQNVMQGSLNFSIIPFMPSNATFKDGCVAVAMLSATYLTISMFGFALPSCKRHYDRESIR